MTPARSTSTPRWLHPASPAGVWTGVVATLIGFALILAGWGQVAGDADVKDQIPPLLGFGITGLAVVLTGLTILVVAVQRRDGDLRQRQLESLASMLLGEAGPDEDGGS
jgi:hypothetical protein